MSIKLIQVDARGISCPEPLILTRRALDQNPAGATVLVDNTTSRDNVVRFVKLLGYQAKFTESEGDFLITVGK